MQEVFKDIKGYEGFYQVSNLGNVKSLNYKGDNQINLLKPQFHPQGYLMVCLCKNKIKNRFYIHRLVGETFLLNNNKYKQVNHLNGIKTDNRVNNLEWCTPSENIKHAFKIGIKNSIKGENHYKCKLTEKQIIEIRKDNRFQRLIANDYNVSISLISSIKNKKRWAHIF